MRTRKDFKLEIVVPTFKRPECIKKMLDFGNHPGKDRLPREAAISGCCIITGKCGSAGNNIDVNIPDQFKFENSRHNIDIIIDTIKTCLDNYPDEFKKFEIYRKSIQEEYSLFISDVYRYFGA